MDLRFVSDAGLHWHQPRVVTVQMRVRERRRNTFPPSSSSGSKASQTDAESRKLTLKIKQAKSVAELLGILDGAVDGPIFSRFQASAAYHSLVMWKRTGRLTPNDKTSQVLPRLAARVQDLAAKGQLEPREVSNVLWSLGQLSDTLGIPKTLLNALVKSICGNASGMNPQDLSNNWLSCVQLKSVAPEVLDAVPAIAGEILTKAKGMTPQALSNSLWASAYLKEDAFHEDVAKILSALVDQIPVKAGDMIHQELSNCLWASAQLQDFVPCVKKIVPSIATIIIDKAEGMGPQELSNSLWAVSQLKDTVPSVRNILPSLAAQIPYKVKDMIPQHLSNCLLAAARLKDDANEVLSIVPALLKEIPHQETSFCAQDFSNCLGSLIVLQDSIPEVSRFLSTSPGSTHNFVVFAAMRFNSLLPRLKGKDLTFGMPVVIWACAKLGLDHEKLLISITKRLKSGSVLRVLTDWSLCALLWSFDVLDPDAVFSNFIKTLDSERIRRGLSDSDVTESRLGYLEWKRTKN